MLVAAGVCVHALLAVAVLVTREGRVLFKSGAMASAHLPFYIVVLIGGLFDVDLYRLLPWRRFDGVAENTLVAYLGYPSKAALGLAVGASLGALLPAAGFALLIFGGGAVAPATTLPVALAWLGLGLAAIVAVGGLVRSLALCDCTGRAAAAAAFGKKSREPSSFERAAGALEGVTSRRSSTRRAASSPASPSARVAAARRSPRRLARPRSPSSASAGRAAARPPPSTVRPTYSQRSLLGGSGSMGGGARDVTLSGHTVAPDAITVSVQSSWLAKAMENVIAADGSERLELHGDDRSRNEATRSQNEAANLRLYGRTSTPRPYEADGTAHAVAQAEADARAPPRRAHGARRARPCLHLPQAAGGRAPRGGSPADAADARPTRSAARRAARRAAPRAPRCPPAASGTCRRPPRAAASARRRRRAAASAPARRWACRSE